MMNPLSPTGQGDQNDEFSAAMAFATNEYQLEDWNRREPRLQGLGGRALRGRRSLASEIRRRAGDRRFAHVLFLSRTSELLGKKRYWPIFEAAVEAGLPDRHPRVRLERAADVQHRLAVVLHRGDDRALPPRWQARSRA